MGNAGIDKNMEIEKYFEKHYPFLGKAKKIRVLRHNKINSINYLISSSKGNYVLRNFIDGSKPEKIEKMCQILKFCLSKKAKVVEPIKRKTGNYVDRENNVYLTRYLEGNNFSGKLAELEEAARNLAILHRILAKNSLPYNYKTNQNYYKILTLSELKTIEKIITGKNRDGFDKKVFKNMSYLDAALRKNKKTAKKVGKLKREIQLIHFDFHPRNVIFDKNKVAAILDFNAMRREEKAGELAFASFRFASFKKKSVQEIKKAMGVFIDNYLSNNDIDGRKLEYLNYYFSGKILERISAILKKRYFAGYDWWIIDFDKNIKFLKLADKIGNFYGK